MSAPVPRKMEIPESFIKLVCSNKWIQQLVVQYETAKTPKDQQDATFHNNLKARLEILNADTIPSSIQSYVRRCFELQSTWHQKERMMYNLKVLLPQEFEYEYDAYLDAADRLAHTIAKGLLEQETA